MHNYPKSLIVGSTGLVGSLLLKDLGTKDGSILLISRRENEYLPQNASEIIINFDDLLCRNIELKEEVDHVYICLGKKLSTYELGYMPQENRESFQKIDLEYCLAAAELGFDKGAKSIAIVSAIGAEEDSFNFYFHIKGKLENSIKKIGYENICIARPGHLLGNRKDFRGYEIPILEGALRLASPIMQGPLKNFRQVEASKVAKKMVEVTREMDGFSILSYDDFV